MEEKSNHRKVCVVGGAGYIGSSIVKKLLEKGYTVHATLRNLNDSSKVELLKSFRDADTGLCLFEGDVYNGEDFESVIKGCEFVFLVATPIAHNPKNSQYKNTTEAALAGVKRVTRSCVRSGTVKRLIYTSSVVAASPLKEDGTGFRNSINESCWTPLHLSFARSNDYVKGYVHSKTLAEKEVLSYGNNGGLEVVTLACGLVGGDTDLPCVPSSVATLVSQLANQAYSYQNLRFLEELLGKVPIVHLHDVCEAHLFCMENPSAKGRFLCARPYLSTMDIASYYLRNYPEIHIAPEYREDQLGREIEWDSTKLNEMGFEYKCDINKILDGSIDFATKMGHLKHRIFKNLDQ